MSSRDIVTGEGRIMFLALAVVFVLGLSAVDGGQVSQVLNGIDRVLYGLF